MQTEDAGAKLRAAAEMAIKSDRKAEEEKASKAAARKNKKKLTLYKFKNK